ncbi:MAG: hypothetical protein U9Q62_12860 [Campylobacterota bacterium]|nr:hypothetical protein [Campylobacterota bacterium]
MKKIVLAVLSLALFALSANAYSTEYSAKQYQKRYCKEKTTSQLQQDYKAAAAEMDQLIKDGSEACKNAGETFNTMKAERKGRKLYDHCESYRHGEIRKQIHKNKIIKRASELELESRGVKSE